MSTRRLNPPNDDRPVLSQDVEFLRFLSERQADAQRDADRCQHDIETWLAQIDSKRAEQSEHLRIVEACTAGIGITTRANRPAPEITTSRLEEEVHAPDPA